MGEKKQKEESGRKLRKILIVIACVFFAVVMVVSSMGSGWITSLRAIQPGDAVVLDYTLYDVMGNPVVTSDQQLWKQKMAAGQGIVLSKQISLTSNESLYKSVYPVQVYSTQTGWDNSFALFSPEFEALSSGTVGMKVHETRKVVIPEKAPMTQTWPAASLARQNMSVADLHVGDRLAMGVSDNPESATDNTTAVTYVRMADVTNVSSREVVVNFGYPAADLSIVSINGR